MEKGKFEETQRGKMMRRTGGKDGDIYRARKATNCCKG